MIELRTARPSDVPELRRVAIETQMDTFAGQNSRENMEAFIARAYTLEQFERELSEENTIYYLAWEGEELAEPSPAPYFPGSANSRLDSPSKNFTMRCSSTASSTSSSTSSMYSRAHGAHRTRAPPRGRRGE